MWATIGSRDGLRPCAQVEFVRCGEVVAKGTVKIVRESDCVITPCPGTPAGMILVGDDVRVCLNGTRRDVDRVLRHEDRLQALGTLVLSYLVWMPK